MSEPGKSPRQFSNAFKERIVLRLEAGERIAAVADETGVRRKLLYEWRDAYRSKGVAGFNRKRGPKPGWKERRAAEGRAASAPAFSPDAVTSAVRPSDELRKAEARIAELERVIGRQQADLHFFREALRLWDATTPNGGAPISTRSSKK
jgi:transposase-like protein